MKFNVLITQVATKTYSKAIGIDADNESQAREKAEDFAMKAEEIENDWEHREDDDWSWDVTELQSCEEAA